MIEQRPLGNSGMTVSAIGLGCVTFGREIDTDTAYEIMDHALENGINFFDTAEGYSSGGGTFGNRNRRLDEVAGRTRRGEDMHQGQFRRDGRERQSHACSEPRQASGR